METVRVREVTALAEERISEVHLAPTQARDEAIGEVQAAAAAPAESLAVVEEMHERVKAKAQTEAPLVPDASSAPATSSASSLPSSLPSASALVALEGFQEAEAEAEGGEQADEQAGEEAEVEQARLTEAEAEEARLAKCVWPPAGMDDPEEQAAWWVGAVTGREQPEGTSLQAWLESGVVLCELMNAISAGSVEAQNPFVAGLLCTFKQMENIAAYAKARQ